MYNFRAIKPKVKWFILTKMAVIKDVDDLSITSNYVFNILLLNKEEVLKMSRNKYTNENYFWTFSLFMGNNLRNVSQIVSLGIDKVERFLLLMYIGTHFTGKKHAVTEIIVLGYLTTNGSASIGEAVMILGISFKSNV